MTIQLSKKEMTGEEFKALRREMGLTQAELAELMGMWRQGVTRIEASERQGVTKKDAAAIQFFVAAHRMGILPQLIDAVKKMRE